MSNPSVKVEERQISGRKVKRLRNEGILPGNIYGKDVKSKAIQVNQKDFETVYKEVGETGLLELVVGKEKRPVLVHNVQLNPVNATILHVDFVQVDLKKKTTAQVPVELVGESPAEKQGLGTVVQYIQEIEVEALPSDFPDKFEIDISQLTEVDQMIQIKDVKVEKSKVEVKESGDEIVAKVEAQKEEAEEPTPSAEVAGEEGAPTEEAGDDQKKGEEQVTKEEGQEQKG